MGWVPEHKRGVSEEPEPAPRRRRRPAPVRRTGAPDLAQESGVKGGAARIRRRKAAAAAVAALGDRDERIADERPAGGIKGAENDSRSRDITWQPGKRWAQIVREVRAGDYTWQQFSEGLTAEELARGQLRDKNGGFGGRPPSFVPREFHLACFRELKRRFDTEFQDGVLAIAKEYVKLAQDPLIPVKDRARMMQYAMERVFGGIPKEVLIKQDAPWESVFAAVIVDGEGNVPDHEQRRYEQFDEEEEGSDDGSEPEHG